jgi:hypothetical protein
VHVLHTSVGAQQLDIAGSCATTPCINGSDGRLVWKHHGDTRADQMIFGIANPQAGDIGN